MEFPGRRGSIPIVLVTCFLAACTAPRVPVPEDLQGRAVELPVERNDGWKSLFGPPLRIDEYAARDVVIGPRGGSSPAERGLLFRFVLHLRGSPLWTIRCQDGSRHDGLRCEAAKGAERPEWILRLDRSAEDVPEGLVEWKDRTFALTRATGTRSRPPTAFLVGANEVPLLVVDVRGEGTVWMADDLAADVRNVLAATAAILLLTANDAG